MHGSTLKNLDMFGSLCGPNALGNIVLTTTMWDAFDPVRGLAREIQLLNTFWRPVLGERCRTARFLNSFGSARDIINLFDVNIPELLQVQREMVEENKPLDATAAFKVLANWLSRLKDRMLGRSSYKPPSGNDVTWSRLLESLLRCSSKAQNGSDIATRMSDLNDPWEDISNLSSCSLSNDHTSEESSTAAHSYITQGSFLTFLIYYILIYDDYSHRPVPCGRISRP